MLAEHLKESKNVTQKTFFYSERAERVENNERVELVDGNERLEKINQRP